MSTNLIAFTVVFLVVVTWLAYPIVRSYIRHVRLGRELRTYGHGPRKAVHEVKPVRRRRQL